MIDTEVIEIQRGLAKLSDTELVTRLADTAIAVGLRMNRSPHHVLGLAARAVGFPEVEWPYVEAQLRERI